MSRLCPGWEARCRSRVERLLGHVSEVVNHEVGSEEGVAAGTVALRSAGEIETSFGEELVLEIEAGLIDISCCQTAGRYELPSDRSW